MPPPSPPPSNARAALQAMITDESLTVSEAVQRCAGAKSANAKLPGFASSPLQAQQRLARE